MPLNQDTLATELEAMVPSEDESAAISNLANAFHNYFLESSVLGIPATPTPLEAAKTAMEGALTGLSSTSSLAIQTGITAYWGAVTPIAPTVWVTVPPIVSATPPPGLTGISAALDAVFPANTTGELNLADASAAIAAAIHPTQLGGIAVITPPPPTTAPIL